MLFEKARHVCGGDSAIIINIIIIVVTAEQPTTMGAVVEDNNNDAVADFEFGFGATHLLWLRLLLLPSIVLQPLEGETWNGCV
jgi:hypothetical protein